MGKKNVIADCFYISSLLFLMPLKKLLFTIVYWYLKRRPEQQKFLKLL